MAGVIFPPNPLSFAWQRVALDGMEKHALVQAALPCGRAAYLLIHK